jgi:cytochrome c biogenesis protein CcdA
MSTRGGISAGEHIGNEGDMAVHACRGRQSAVIALAAVVVSIALADSVNPTTVIPALYLATGPHPGRTVLGFAAGFFAVNAVGGLLALGLGNRVAGVVRHVRGDVLGAGEIVAGLVALLVGALLWHRRHAASERIARSDELVRRFAPAAGAGLAAVELPTAVPYFAVLALLATSGESAAALIALVLVFNLVFLAPVLVVAIVASVAGRRTDMLASARAAVLRYSGAAAALLVCVVGAALVALGVRGVVRGP